MSLNEGRVKRCRNVRRQLLPNLEAVISWVKCNLLHTLLNKEFLKENQHGVIGYAGFSIGGIQKVLWTVG
jgi:hypothetical protein